MFEKELESLLNKKWTDEQRSMISTLKDNAIYYKSFIPKSFRQDITNALKMCNDLKIELENYKEKCKCMTLSHTDENLQGDENLKSNENLQGDENLKSNEN